MGLLVSPEEALHPGARRRDARAEATGPVRTIADASSSATWLSPKCPAAANARARASSSSTRSSGRAVSGAGERRRTIAQRSRVQAELLPRQPCAGVRPHRGLPDALSSTCWARAATAAPRAARASAHRRARQAASRPAWSRRPPVARVGAGIGTVAARPSGGSDRAARARRSRRARPSRPSPPRPRPAQARTAHRRLPRLRAPRAPAWTAAPASVNAAATADGTPIANESSEAAGAVPSARSRARASSGDRVGCRPSLRTAPPPRSPGERRRGGHGSRRTTSRRVRSESACPRGPPARATPSQSRRRPARPQRQSDQHGSGGRPAQQCAQQLDRCRVGPVDIIENEHERRRRRELLQELADGSVGPVPLVLWRHLDLSSEPRQRREDVRELCPDRQHLPLGRSIQACHVLIERIDEDGERQLVLELRSRADEDDARGLRPRERLALLQAVSCRPRFAVHRDSGWTASSNSSSARSRDPSSPTRPTMSPVTNVTTRDLFHRTPLVRVARPGHGGPKGPSSPLAHGPVPSKRRNQGPAQGDPRCSPGSQAARWRHASLPPPSPSRPGRVRRGVHVLQGTRERAPAPCDLGLVPLGRALIWWTVDAESERDALRLLPPYVVERTTITRQRGASHESSPEGVVRMTDSRVSPTVSPAGDVVRHDGGTQARADLPHPGAPSTILGMDRGPDHGARDRSTDEPHLGGLARRWGNCPWADLSHRDQAGYVTTNAHAFSTAGSALATEPIELGDPGSLGSTRPSSSARFGYGSPPHPGSTLFVGIGPSADVDGYLSGVSQTVISDFWTERLEATGGGTPDPLPIPRTSGSRRSAARVPRP